MRGLIVPIVFSVSLSIVVPCGAQSLYDQGARGPSTQQGAGRGYVSPYNEPAREAAPNYLGYPGAGYSAPSQRQGYDLMAPAPQPVQRQPSWGADYDNRAYNRQQR